MCFWQLTEIRPRFGLDGLKHNGMHFINSSEIADPRWRISPALITNDVIMTSPLSLKIVANFMILSLPLIFQYFSVYGYFYEKIN